jgi:lipoprotein NlpI
MFEGKTTGEAVLASVAEAGADKRFYAELYVGLNLAVEGKSADARPHLARAVENGWAPKAGYGPAYMWHVGRLQLSRLK